MAPVGYTFNANKPAYRSKERGEAKRRIAIFVVLTALFAVILYFWVFKDNKKKGSEKPENKYSPPVQKPAEIEERPVVVNTEKPVRTIVEKTEPEPPAATMSFPKIESILEKAEEAYAKEEYAKVREYCYQILDSRKVPDEHPLWLKTVDVLGKANVKIIFSDYPFPKKKVNYHVQANDGIRKIAMMHNTSDEVVQRSNNMKTTDYNVQLGKTFNIYVGDWKIIISKSRRKLYLFDGKKIFKVYDIGIGKQDRTPTGIFKTGGKRKDPDWYSPEGKIPFGDKRNVLGTRWIRLNPAGETSRPVSGLGIHGTWVPESIGKAESNGCLRLLNKDVEELFAIIPNERKPVPVRIIK